MLEAPKEYRVFRTWEIKPEDEVHLYFRPAKYGKQIEIHRLEDGRCVPLGMLLRCDKFDDVLEVQNTDNEMFKFKLIGRRNYG